MKERLWINAICCILIVLAVTAAVKEEDSSDESINLINPRQETSGQRETSAVETNTLLDHRNKNSTDCVQASSNSSETVKHVSHERPKTHFKLVAILTITLILIFVLLVAKDSIWDLLMKLLSLLSDLIKGKRAPAGGSSKGAGNTQGMPDLNKGSNNPSNIQGIVDASNVANSVPKNQMSKVPSNKNEILNPKQVNKVIEHIPKQPSAPLEPIGERPSAPAEPSRNRPSAALEPSGDRPSAGAEPSRNKPSASLEPSRDKPNQPKVPAGKSKPSVGINLEAPDISNSNKPSENSKVPSNKKQGLKDIPKPGDLNYPKVPNHPIDNKSSKKTKKSKKKVLVLDGGIFKNIADKYRPRSNKNRDINGNKNGDVRINEDIPDIRDALGSKRKLSGFKTTGKNSQGRLNNNAFSRMKGLSGIPANKMGFLRNIVGRLDASFLVKTALSGIGIKVTGAIFAIGATAFLVGAAIGLIKAGSGAPIHGLTDEETYKLCEDFINNATAAATSTAASLTTSAPSSSTAAAILTSVASSSTTAAYTVIGTETETDFFSTTVEISENINDIRETTVGLHLQDTVVKLIKSIDRNQNLCATLKDLDGSALSEVFKAEVIFTPGGTPNKSKMRLMAVFIPSMKQFKAIFAVKSSNAVDLYSIDFDLNTIH
ncbi:hypothetical protein NEAUS05_2007 [Nematocida ausubeli]|nr:hypothetical protein NEAUS05_2007 [Nematocida ausubeli]